MNAIDSESAVSARSSASGSPWSTSGSGSQGPTYASRRARAERSWSIASRVVMAVR